MKQIDIKQHLLPLYLIVVILIQIELTVQNILLSCSPLIIISISIYLRNKLIGIVGIFLFYTVSLSQILITNMEDFQFVFLELVFLVLPSIILLNLVLQLGNKEVFYLSEHKKPLIIAASILITITVIFYLLTIVLWEGFLLSPKSIDGQILLLMAITLVCTTPFLFKN